MGDFVSNTTADVPALRAEFLPYRDALLDLRAGLLTVSGGTGGGGVAVAAGSQTAASGTVVFADANGLTFGMSGSSQVTASYTVPSVTQYLTTAQPPGAYLTTAALSDHAHTQYLTTAQPVGAYLTTAMASNAGSAFLAATGALALTNLSGTLGSGGLSLSADLPTGGGGAGTNGAITGGSITVNTSGVSVALPAYLTTAQPVGAYLTTAALSQDSSRYAGTSGAITGGSITVNTSGVSVNLPAYLTTAQPVGAYLTTAALSDHTHSQYQSTGAYLTTAMLSNASTGFMLTGERAAYFYTSNNTFANATHSHGNPTLALTNLSGTTASASSGFTLSLSAAAPGGGGAVSFSGGTSSAALGSVVFSNANGVSFGLNGSTMTASVSPGGGAAPERRYVQVIEGERFTTVMALSATAYTNRPLIQPFWIDGTGLQANTVRMMLSIAGSSNRSFGGTFRAGIYSQNNDTQITLLTSASLAYSITASSQSSAYNGAAMLDFTGMSGFTVTAEGRYALVWLHTPVSANATWMPASLYGADPMPVISRILTNNTTVATGNTGVSAFLPFWGAYSTTTTGMPSAIGLSQVYGGNSASLVDLYAIIKEI